MLPQLFAHQNEPKKEVFIPVANRPHFPKPSGGLWTSTYDKHRGSEWVQWCLGEEFRSNPFRSWLLIPSQGVRVFTVHDVSDILWLCGRYPKESECLSSAASIDWPRIAEDFDGVRLTKDGECATRFSKPYDFYGWDCESTVWFRWAFDEVVNLGEVNYTHGTEVDPCLMNV